jgi:hypothetical protein
MRNRNKKLMPGGETEKYGSVVSTASAAVAATSAAATVATTSAATASTTTAVTTTSATTPAAATWGALASFIDRNGTTIDLGSVERLDGLLAGVFTFHLHKSKTARAAGITIGNYFRRSHGAVSTKQRFQLC